MVATFHLHCLGHRIRYRNPEVGNTTQQFLSTKHPCCSIAFIELFLFWVILVTNNTGIYICIYICQVSYIHFYFFCYLQLLSSTAMFFLHCMLNILKYEKIFYLTGQLLHSTIHQVMWNFWVFIVNPFSLSCRNFFLKKTVFPLVSLPLAYSWVNQPRYFW